MNTQRAGKITASPSPLKPHSFQVTYETATSRRVIDLPAALRDKTESPPHGAGSYHDQDQHRLLLDRAEAMLRCNE